MFACVLNLVSVKAIVHMGLIYVVNYKENEDSS